MVNLLSEKNNFTGSSAADCASPSQRGPHRVSKDHDSGSSSSVTVEPLQSLDDPGSDRPGHTGPGAGAAAADGMQ